MTNDMFIPVVLSLGVIFITILIHGIGTAWSVQFLSNKQSMLESKTGLRYALNILSITAVFLMLLHFVEIVVWAVVFMVIPDINQLTTLEESIYFSMVTYATLGYGDITLGPHWRIMSGFCAMDGILLFGWSTAMFFLRYRKFWCICVCPKKANSNEVHEYETGKADFNKVPGHIVDRGAIYLGKFFVSSKYFRITNPANFTF